MIAYYKNSRGQKINLLEYPYRAIEADWYDADWEETGTEYERKVTLDVLGKTSSELVSNLENLYQVIAVDVAPLAGAWIEIEEVGCSMFQLTCRSPRGSVD